MADRKAFRVADVLARSLRERPGADALVGRYARYTYRELDEAAARAAAALARLGIGAGDRVAACLPNHPDIVVAFLGAMRLGAIWLGINRDLAPPEKSYLLGDAQPDVVLADPEMAGDFREAPCLLEVLAEDGTGTWTELLGEVAPGDAPSVEVDPHAPAAIAYTGGTTGFPKGALHSQHNLVLVGAVHAALGDDGPDLRCGVLLPLTILNLIVLAPLRVFQGGGCCVAMDRVDPVGIAEWVRSERIQLFGCVPTILHGLLTHPDVHDDDLASLTRPEVGGADCPDEFRELFRKRFGMEVLTGYGMTEAPTAVTLQRPDGPFVPGCVGPALPHVRIAVRDDDGRELPAGEEGEVCVEPATDGPWAGVYTTMLGYWNRPEATAEALRNGVLHSGDVGALDDEGNLFLHGRRGDLIIRGGANVYPAEVERVLHENPGVAACAVLGRPDERLGERVVAYVQAAEGVRLDLEELRAHCAKRLARYKVPAEFVFVDDFPRTPMGKIRKIDLV